LYKNKINAFAMGLYFYHFSSSNRAMLQMSTNALKNDKGLLLPITVGGTRWIGHSALA
jgi:hypothetical protein